MEKLLIAAASAQAMLFFALLALGEWARIKAGREGRVDVQAAGSGKAEWPEDVKKLSAAFNNQFELPTFFFAAVAIALAAEAAGLVMTAAAWAYIGCRMVQAWIAITTNRVTHRFYAFLAAVGCLAVMWAWLSFAAIGGGAIRL